MLRREKKDERPYNNAIFSAQEENWVIKATLQKMNKNRV